MIILPSVGSLDILWHRDCLSPRKGLTASFGIYFPYQENLFLAANPTYLLETSLNFISCMVEDEPVWMENLGNLTWKGGAGTNFTLAKPFYDTAEIKANRDSETDESFAYEKLSHRPLPFDCLRGIPEGSAPEEYTVIYDLVVRSLKDYETHDYPWLLDFKPWSNQKGHVLLVSRTSGLLIGLKAMEMAFGKEEEHFDFEGILHMHRIEPQETDWRQLGREEIIGLLQAQGRAI